MEPEELVILTLRALEEIGAEAPGYVKLMLLLHYADRAVGGVAEWGERLHLPHSRQLDEALERLVEWRLITIEQVGTTRKNYEVRLTEEGATLAEWLASNARSDYKKILKAMSEYAWRPLDELLQLTSKEQAATHH